MVNEIHQCSQAARYMSVKIIAKKLVRSFRKFIAVLINQQQDIDKL